MIYHKMIVIFKFIGGIFIIFLRLFRVKHWVKNGLIFLPLLCSGKLFDCDRLSNTFSGFFVFCLLSSIVYIVNDIKDAENDRAHETKRSRPIASGRVKEWQGVVCVTFLLFFSIVINFLISGADFNSWVACLLYLSLNLFYSLGLKNFPLIDIAILVSGFMLRLIYGGIVSNIFISGWLLLVVMSFALYLSLGKRRGELLTNGNTARKSLRYYNVDFLNKFMSISMGMTIIFYSLWTMDRTAAIPESGDNLIWTVPALILICMRYAMLVETPKNSGDPIEVLLGDKLLVIFTLLYLFLLFFIMYGSVVFI